MFLLTPTEIDLINLLREKNINICTFTHSFRKVEVLLMYFLIVTLIVFPFEPKITLLERDYYKVQLIYYKLYYHLFISLHTTNSLPNSLDKEY